MQAVIERITEIITTNFPNGIRNDFIDSNKVLQIYSADYDDEIISRNKIAEIIHSNGIAVGGRFYFLSENDIEQTKFVFEEILEAFPIAFYSAVHEKHADFFARVHIFSPEVLKKILRKTAEVHFYFEDFCSASRMTRLDYEISKIFMTAKKSLSLNDLQEKLPYVPAEKISTVLSGTKKYLPTNEGKYFPVSKIQLDAEELDAAKLQMLSEIDANGFATIEDHSFSSCLALNPELNKKDLLNVIYRKFFSADFIKRGKKFFKKGAVVKRNATGAVKVIRDFVARHDELPVKELFAFAKNFDPAPSIALYVAHETMTRVDKNLFVKDELIDFDITGIDAALISFVQGKIISLRDVTSFTGFPTVKGYSWNLFLLESFLRKFSRRYVYASPAANSANLGAILPKSMNFEDYLDVQAAVVVQENIPLEKSSVEEFLIGHGFRAKRIDKVTARIIIRAQEFIDERS